MNKEAEAAAAGAATVATLAVGEAMTIAAAPRLLALGCEHIAAGGSEVDLSSVSEVDSSALAVLFGWQRAAVERGGPLRVLNAPRNLLSLAELYGVADLPPIATAAS